MKMATDSFSSTAARSPDAPGRLQSLIGALDEICSGSEYLVKRPLGCFKAGGKEHELPSYVFMGPTSGGEPIRIGVFAGIHGDEPAGSLAILRFAHLLEQSPEIARGYCLFFYPVCNPTGFAAGTRTAVSGKDLNREFWRQSDEPEVQLLEQEIYSRHFQGIVALHSDDTSSGMYGFVRGATLTKSLLEPALQAIEPVLPRNRGEIIDGFRAHNGIILDCYPGVLSAAPGVHPQPFELILETPHAAPLPQQEQAFVIALKTVLTEYQKFIAYAADL